MKGVWTLAPNPTVEVHCNNFVARIVWHINIFNMDINSWVNSCESLSDFPLGVICNFLPDYLQ